MPRRAQPSPELLSVVNGPTALVSAQGQDLSGSDFLPTKIHGGNFFEAIFNGCRFNGINAQQAVFQHTEFTEAHLQKCVFEDTSFDHSDFVLTTISDTVFVRCSFQNAEWRDAIFERVQFRQCIFRNTTASVVHFRSCEFDDASAANFVGASKRYCLFSATAFRLPANEISFLKTNFGLQSDQPIALPIVQTDPLFELSARRYALQLSEHDCYRLLRTALAQVTTNAPQAERLRLRYLSEICRMLIREDALSVFAIKLLDRLLAKEAERARDSEQALQIFGLILAVRLALGERVASLAQELSLIPERATAGTGLLLEFENTYSRRPIDQYLGQLAAFCGLHKGDLRVCEIRKGSTIVETILGAATPLREVVRFIRYSISAASVTLKQADEMRKSYRKLTAGRKATLVKRPQKVNRKAEALERAKTVEAIVGKPNEETKRIEIFVDQAKEQIFVVGGRVRVTVSYAD